MSEILSIRRTFRLRPSEDAELAQEAFEYGYGLSTFIRIKLLNKTDGLCIRRQPTPDMPLLYATHSALCELSIKLQAIGNHLYAIQDQLGVDRQNIFGLEGTLRRLMQLDHEIHQATSAVNDALYVRTFNEDEIRRFEAARQRETEGGPSHAS